MQRTMILFAVFTALAAAAQAKDKPQLTVEVLQAETVHWTTYWRDNGSAGTTTTDCNLYDTSVSCTSTTEGARPASSTPIYHTQVNLLVKMPDGNTVPMQCHYPPIWATCVQPELGTYAANINGHNIHLLIPVFTGKAKYNNDGTLKKPAKTGIKEVKFSFRDGFSAGTSTTQNQTNDLQRGSGRTDPCPCVGSRNEATCRANWASVCQSK
jgi:hypothetical protein